MLLLDLLADVVQAEFVIDLLQEQVAAIVTAPLVFLDKGCRRVFYNNFFICRLFRGSEFGNIFFCFAYRVLVTKTLPQIVNGTQALHILGGTFAGFSSK